MPLLDMKPHFGSEGFILSDVSGRRQFPGNWGFEVFTKERIHLARFTYSSEDDARRAAKEFGWLMGKLSSICLSEESSDPITSPSRQSGYSP
jgi:hypothetical protein